MYLVTKHTSVSEILELPENGEGDGRPNVDVEAYRSRNIPVRGLECEEGPDLGRSWAK